MDYARQDEKHLCFGNWCSLYSGFDGMLIKDMTGLLMCLGNTAISSYIAVTITVYNSDDNCNNDIDKRQRHDIG